MDIGAAIKRFRTQKKMKQKDLAEMLHISPQAISSWEKNRTQPNMEMIEAMCLVFNCKKSDFLSESVNDGLVNNLFFSVSDVEDIPDQEMLVSDQEMTLIQSYRTLSDADKHMIVKLMRLMRYAQVMGDSEDKGSL